MFSKNLFCNTNYAYFIYNQMPQIVDIEYPQGICFPIFVVEDFSELFLQLFIFYY